MTSSQRKKREQELRRRLAAHEILRLRGVEFHMGERSGVVVERWGHFIGVWVAQKEGFAWTPASHLEATDIVADEDAAIRHTLLVIASL